MDATEHITQLNRSLENNILKSVEYLTTMLYSQLGITQEIMNGTRRMQHTRSAPPAGCTSTPGRKRAGGRGERMETVIAAIVTGAITLIGVLIANSKSYAVMEYKIEELTREVRKHNGFAEKIPVIQRDIDVMNHRIGDLEAHEHERERNN